MFEFLAFVSLFVVVTLLVTSVFQRSIKALLAFALFFTFALGDALPILASSDITRPTVKSISFDKAIVQAGEKLHIQVEAEDLDSGVNQLYVKLKRAIGGIEKTLFLNYNAVSQKYEGTFDVPINAGNGIWEVNFIYANDRAGNEYYTIIKEGSELYQSFTVTGGFDDTTIPTIKSIKLDKGTVEPGAQILVQVEAEDSESGVNQLYVKLKRAIGGIETTLFLNYNAVSQKYEGTFDVPINAGNGIWEVNFIYANDKAGNEYYTIIKEGSELYQSFTVAGGFDDTTIPTIKSIKIDKETVEPGAQILVQVEAEDLDSGIKTIYVTLQKEGGGVEKTIFLTYDEKTKRYEGTYNVPSDAENGKWELFFIYANDKAGNEYYTIIKEGSELYQSFNIIKDIIPPQLLHVNGTNER